VYEAGGFLGTKKVRAVDMELCCYHSKGSGTLPGLVLAALSQAIACSALLGVADNNALQIGLALAVAHGVVMVPVQPGNAGHVDATLTHNKCFTVV